MTDSNENDMAEAENENEQEPDGMTHCSGCSSRVSAGLSVCPECGFDANRKGWQVLAIAAVVTGIIGTLFPPILIFGLPLWLVFAVGTWGNNFTMSDFN